MFREEKNKKQLERPLELTWLEFFNRFVAYEMVNKFYENFSSVSSVSNISISEMRDFKGIVCNPMDAFGLFALESKL